VVLDPFCGRGATLFAARMRGLSSIGIDSNPVAAAISAANLSDTTTDAVITTAKDILANDISDIDIPTGEYWDMCYHPDTLRDICILRQGLINRCQSDAEIMLRAIILGILHGPLNTEGRQIYLSNQLPVLYTPTAKSAMAYWRRNDLTAPPLVDVLSAIAMRARYSLWDPPPPTGGMVYLGDAQQSHRLLPSGRKANIVITSPPYFGMCRYASDQWIRNWFLGGKKTKEYQQHGQIPHKRVDFEAALAAAWASVAKVCAPGATLVVRFGVLPSMQVDPLALCSGSISAADAGWVITDHSWVIDDRSRRRINPEFPRAVGPGAPEVDIYARLDI
jgi:hypothetical protein